MGIKDYESDLVAELNRVDGLIAACIQGHLSGTAFLEQYDCAYQRWAMDGHEASSEELHVLSRHKGKISILAQVWLNIECRVTKIVPTPDDWIGPDDVSLALKRILSNIEP